MNAILLCAGPSLAWAPETFDADLVVAVNRAALLRQCGIWACGDWPLIEAIRDQVQAFQTKRPTLFTASNSHAWLRDQSPKREWGDPDGHDVIELESLYDGHEHELQWTCFTATAALWLCHRKGATRVDVYGADWGGRDYCDGSPISQNRVDLGQTSWDLERTIWERLIRVTGMEVIRHVPQKV